MNNKFNLPTVFVIFGITGDLVKHKILSALFHLYSKDMLPKMFQVVGFSRREWSHEDLRIYLKNILKDYEDIHTKDIDTFLSKFFYIQGDFNDKASYQTLATFLGQVDGDGQVCSNKLFYLAVPPNNYQDIIIQLKESGLTIPCSQEEGWTRVILEKPFGQNLKHAIALDKLLAELFKEEQIYRVDHYLGKETVRNILAFRFSNSFMSPSWNNSVIEKIEMRLFEADLVSERGTFYDKVGALRDIGQNHLLQLLALFTMDNPVDFNGINIRQKRIEILSKLKPLSVEQVTHKTRRGQYEGYTKEKGVDPESETETYFRIETEIDDPKWKGVPIILEHGKAMSHEDVEARIMFRHPVGIFFLEDHKQNVLHYQVQPEEKIIFNFLVKKPGHNDNLEVKKFEFDYKKEFEGEEFIEAYEKLILDMIKGDQTLFVSTEEILFEWNFVEPILHSWSHHKPELFIYPVKQKPTLLREAKSDEFTKEVAVIGLGKMGGNVALQLLKKGWSVAGFNRTLDKTKSFVEKGMIAVPQVQLLASQIKSTPAIYILSLTAGHVIDELLFGENGLISVLRKGDIVIDMGNSFYKDSIERAKKLKEKEIHFIDVGISGGPSGALNGACLMVGGDKEIYEYLMPLFKDISLPGAIAFFQGAGAGHFVKMVHNGIEYGIMQSIAEGFTILKNSHYNIDVIEAARIYNNGSVIESRLIGWLYQAYVTFGTDLNAISGKVNFTGEGEWTVQTAEEMNSPISVLKESFEFRKKSQEVPSYTGQIVSALRGQFGGHPVLKEHNIPMKPFNIKTKFFLDSGDPLETKHILNTIGFLDGQTTNPSLVAKNPDVKARLQKGEKFSLQEIYGEYKKIVKDISHLIPQGSVSIEVYADKTTKAEEMLSQGKEMFSWIHNAHIKFPTTSEGLKAATMAIKEGMRVNMTLCFSEEQAAAVYVATKGAKKGDVYISPFIGRLDDIGLNGVDLIKNIVNLYKTGDDHVEVLSASIRNLDHLYDSIIAEADIVTVPGEILVEWCEHNFIIPEKISNQHLEPIPFKNSALDKSVAEYDIHHELTDKGIEKFVSDWDNLIK